MAVRLPDPFTHPGMVPGFLSAPLTDYEPLIQDELPNGKVLEVKTSTQYWGLTITYPPLYPDEYKIISSAIMKAKNTDGVIQVALPQYLNMHVIGNESLTTIAAGQKGNTLVINNASGLSGNPHVGDLFKLSTHEKVYKIVDFERVSPSQLRLELYPNLLITTNGTEKPVFNNLLFNMKLVGRTSIQENLNVDGMYTDVSYTLREAV
ncbi:hypothetical protein [Vibrio phage JSF12]|uniref:Distal tail protein n=3 Tax=Jesfedecavirus TaxID=2560156 RepID=A0A2D0YXI6_9CAUD|nr:distal tail protein [Vibrio phage phi 3]YP_009618491.1 distal tail protein [Vibrio phage JSF10]YP_009794800.1 distal tail protein [Vibrio phage JSF12]AJF40895.1 hypothetical protein SBVP3_00128 [Vibrio phage phi 3]ASV43464.1 hypothetical protein [Vibrio phage JSF10]ASV43635.1 hypothetical protein [Vibrio phage JSF12]